MATLSTIAWRQWDTNPSSSPLSYFTTKMFTFEALNRKKTIIKLAVIAYGPHLQSGFWVYFRTSNNGTWYVLNGVALTNNSDTYTIHPDNDYTRDLLKGIEQIQFKFVMMCPTGYEIEIDDINIFYRLFRNTTIDESED